MRFGRKLTLALLCVLALVLGLCTLWTQDRQWQRALRDARASALAGWQREADALQQGLLPDDEYSNYNEELYSRAWRYLMQPGAPRAALAVYGQDGTLLASSMPVTLAQDELARALPGDADLRLLTAVAADGSRYFLCSGLVLLPEECVTLVSAQSLDGLFADRALRLRGRRADASCRPGGGCGADAAVLPPDGAPAGTAGGRQPPDRGGGLRPAHRPARQRRDRRPEPQL